MNRDRHCAINRSEGPRVHCRHLEGGVRAYGWKKLLVVGGAGFLGYYLVQSVLHWNANAGSASPIQLTVYDNYIRGVPPWLSALESNPHLTLVRHDISQPLVRHDISQPLPADIPDFQFIVHGGLDRIARLLPQVPDRDDGRERQRFAQLARLRVEAEVGEGPGRRISVLLEQ
ncbi:MAG: hypothetical protein WDO74_30750 [Pseudomonadota bacterium]